nr:hypothetical protein 6 [Desulfobacterales bacterium]
MSDLAISDAMEPEPYDTYTTHLQHAGTRDAVERLQRAYDLILRAAARRRVSDISAGGQAKYQDDSGQSDEDREGFCPSKTQ